MLVVEFGRSSTVRPTSPLSKNQRLPNQAMSRSTSTGMSSDWISGLLRCPYPKAAPSRQRLSPGAGAVGGVATDPVGGEPACPNASPATVHNAAIFKTFLNARMMTGSIAQLPAETVKKCSETDGYSS